MRKLIIALSIFLTFSTIIYADPPSRANGRNVYDLSGVLSQSERNILNRVLAEYCANKFTNIVVVIENDIKIVDINNFANRTFESYSGNSHYAKFALLFYTPLYGKWSVKISPALEYYLPTKQADEIFTGLTLPLFWQKRYSEGIFGGINEIIKKIAWNEKQKELLIDRTPIVIQDYNLFTQRLARFLLVFLLSTLGILIILCVIFLVSLNP